MKLKHELDDVFRNLAFSTEGGTFSMKPGSDVTVSFSRPYRRRGDKWEEYHWEFDLAMPLDRYINDQEVEAVPMTGAYRMTIDALQYAQAKSMGEAPVARAFKEWFSDGARG